MKNKQEETLLTWLRDAYAMEEGLVESLDRQVDQMKEMPDAQAKIRQHRELTKTQAARVKDCIERLGGDVSHTKSAVANVMGAIQGMSTAAAQDKALKNTMANFAIEHFEIASYKALATAARQLGHNDIASTCEDIMMEEEQMADWVGQQLPMITQMELQTA